MPFKRRPAQSRRPRKRQFRRLGPPPLVARVSFHPGSRSFTANEFGNPFQGYSVVAKFQALLLGSDFAYQSEARLVFLRVVLPPNTTGVPLGLDVLVKGFPNVPSEGLMVGRTSRFLSTVNSTTVSCRLPIAVTQTWLYPRSDEQHQLLFHLRYYADKPTTAAILPHITLELRFQQQPLQTHIAA